MRGSVVEEHASQDAASGAKEPFYTSIETTNVPVSICATREMWIYAHLDLGDEVIRVLLCGAAVHLVDVLRDHARICKDARLSRDG